MLAGLLLNMFNEGCWPTIMHRRPTITESDTLKLKLADYSTNFNADPARIDL